MSVDPKLLHRLQDKLGVSRRHVNRLIQERARAMVLPREQAALALALESGIPVSRYASTEDLSAIREAAFARARPSTPGGREPEIRPRRQTPARKTPARKLTQAREAKRRKVMVVHGRDAETRKAMFEFLRAVGLDPVEWNRAIKETGKASPYVGEVLEAAFRDAGAVVVLLTPDDEARLRPHLRKTTDPEYEAKLTGQARPNVLFEAGMAFGRHPESTVIVQIGAVRPFSDIAGRHVVQFTGHAEARVELATKLENAGCKVDLAGTDWLSAGNFPA